jgi:hypothetical protein
MHDRLLWVLVTIRVPIALTLAGFSVGGNRQSEQSAKNRLRLLHGSTPRFVKHSIDAGEKVKIAAIDPDFV